MKKNMIIKFILVVLTVFFIPVSGFSDSLNLEPVLTECVVGEKLYFRINITLDEEKDIDVSDIKFKGKPLKYDASQSSNSSFSFSINGRTIKQSSGIEKSFVFEVPADDVGEIVLPEYKVRVGDKSYKIKSQRFNVLKKPTSSDFQFITRIKNYQKQYYPTQIIEVEYKLYYREFPGSPSDLEFSIPMVEQGGFNLIPYSRKPDGYVSVNNKRFGIIYEEKTERLDGREYNVFLFKLKFRLMKPGTYNIRNSIKAQVETGKTFRRRGFFGTELVKEKKPIYADSPIVYINIRELPSENVPPSFNGAIGDFKINVIPSSDTDLKVGDPITLSVEISGRGTWEFVKCPPVHKMPEITDYFKVSSDPVIGEVAENGTVKTFLLRMRVKSRTVKEIPPIPFTFFNLIKQKYVTVYSNKIPISVYESSRQIEVVDFAHKDDTVTDEAKSSSEENGRSKNILQKRKQMEEPLPELIPILDNVDSADLTEDHAPHYHCIIYAIIPLLIVCIICLVLFFRNLNVGSELISKNKRKMAYQIFRNNISHLEKKDIDGSFFYRDLGRSMLNFCENRYSINVEEINHRILEPLVASNDISLKNAETLVDLYEDVQLKRYSSEKFKAKDARVLLKKVKEILKICK